MGWGWLVVQVKIIVNVKIKVSDNIRAQDVGTVADFADRSYQWADGERRVGTAADSGETGAGLLTRAKMRMWSRASSKDGELQMAL